MLVFEKSDAKERFLVVVNVRNAEAVADVPAAWQGLKVEDEMTDRHLTLGPTLELKPYEYVILSIED